MSIEEINRYRALLDYDLAFHKRIPYNADPITPIHRWYLIPESPSTKWVQVLMDEAEKTNYCFVFNPFLGSGTVALQSILNDKHFVGGDILADLAIASMAKVSSIKIVESEFSESADNLQSFIEQKSHEAGSRRRNLTELQLFDLAESAQNLILSVATSNYCKYALLSAIYSALRALSPSNPKGVSYWKNALDISLSYIKDDLSVGSIQANMTMSSNWIIHHGDSTKIDWGESLFSLNIPIPAKGLLLTSPTYVQTSQDRSKNARFVTLLGEKAISQLVPASNTGKIHADNDYSNSARNFIERAPGPLRAYLDTLAKVLTSFQRMASSRSWALIANENPQINNSCLDLDLYICCLAKLVGYSPLRIRVTHYLEKPGIITASVTDRRGSVIYLELD